MYAAEKRTEQKRREENRNDGRGRF